MDSTRPGLAFSTRALGGPITVPHQPVGVVEGCVLCTPASGPALLTGELGRGAPPPCSPHQGRAGCQAGTILGDPPRAEPRSRPSSPLPPAHSRLPAPPPPARWRLDLLLIPSLLPGPPTLQTSAAAGAHRLSWEPRDLIHQARPEVGEWKALPLGGTLMALCPSGF